MFFFVLIFNFIFILFLFLILVLILILILVLFLILEELSASCRQTFEIRRLKRLMVLKPPLVDFNFTLEVAHFELFILVR